MPGKTFAFGPDSEKVLEDLLDLYLHATALVQALRALLDEAGIDHPDVAGRLAAWDQKMVDVIRRPPTRLHPEN